MLHEDVNLIQEKPYVPEPDDADEARDGLVVAARDALRRSRMRDKSLISDLFQGQLVAKKTCKVCARSSVKFEPFTSLSLPVLTQRLFLWFSELQYHEDGVNATSRRRDAVDGAVRESRATAVS